MYLLNFFIGACLASHACLIYDRYPGQQICFARSVCTTCQFELSVLDEIPIVSFWLLGGKCRYCQNSIPIELLFFEFLGGCALSPIDVFDVKNISTILFIFFFLLIAIFDYHDGQFPTWLLLPLFLCIILHYPNFEILNLLSSLPILFLFLFFIFKKSLGSGDLFIYLALVLFFNCFFANLITLLACLSALFVFLFNSKQESFHFIPFLFFSFAILNLAWKKHPYLFDKSAFLVSLTEFIYLCGLALFAASFSFIWRSMSAIE